jgi:hypothetical protein
MGWLSVPEHLINAVGSVQAFAVSVVDMSSNPVSSPLPSRWHARYRNISVSTKIEIPAAVWWVLLSAQALSHLLPHPHASRLGRCDYLCALSII